MNCSDQEYYQASLKGTSISTFVGLTFTGKERDDETGYSYFGARYYDAGFLTGWISVDPMSDKYPSLSPYNYCALNPVKLADPDGRDWYKVNNPETRETEIKWTNYHNQDEMDKNGTKGIYLGEVVVWFHGYYDEKFGKNNSMDPKQGAISAKVAVYGKDGTISDFVGSTMTSDFNYYGAIDNGEYYAKNRSHSKLGDVYQLYNTDDHSNDKLNCLFGTNYAFNNNVPFAYSSTQKDGVLIHQGGQNDVGRCVKPAEEVKNHNVTTGCLTIMRSQWDAFKKVVGENPAHVIVTRSWSQGSGRKAPECVTRHY
mgnify:CR=1 FL=1